jgi:hypothetical protein
MPLKDIHTHSHAINPNLNLTFGLNTSSAIQIQRNLNEMHCKPFKLVNFLLVWPKLMGPTKSWERDRKTHVFGPWGHDLGGSVLEAPP